MQFNIIAVNICKKLIKPHLQALCMLTSCLVVVVVGNNLVGGSGIVFQKSYEAERIEIFNFDMSPLTRHTFWSQVSCGISIKCVRTISFNENC